MFERYYGNQTVASALENMIARDRVPQTILLAGPEGVGKATLVRRFAARLLGGADKIEQDDLSLSANLERVSEREKLTSDKRGEDPLYFSSHPDFVTFPPDGPLRQVSIQQMRLLKEQAQLSPSRGRHRIFLIDHLDRANEQAANSLLKTLEEPPDHLILISTAENYYDLLPTIRSRAVIFHLSTLSREEMSSFANSQGLAASDPRIALAGGCPGIAVSMDLEEWNKRRQRMIALLQVACGQEKFGAWVKYSETISASKNEKLEYYVKVLYSMVEDVLFLREGMAAVRNPDLAAPLGAIAARVSFDWLTALTKRVDELTEFARRNVQKGIALDALAVEMRRAS